MADDVRELCRQLRLNADALRKRWWAQAASGTADAKLVDLAVDHLEVSFLMRHEHVPRPLVEFASRSPGSSLKAAVAAVSQSKRFWSTAFLATELDLLAALRELQRMLKAGRGSSTHAIRESLRVGELLPEVLAYHSGTLEREIRSHLKRAKAAAKTRILTGQKAKIAREIFEREKKRLQRSARRRITDAQVIKATQARLLTDHRIEVDIRTLRSELLGPRGRVDPHHEAKLVLARLKKWENALRL